MRQLPSYQDLKNQYPLTTEQQLFINDSRQTIHEILNGQDPRLLLVVGPCSIHDTISAKEFAVQLKNLAETVSSQFFIVMRVYCEKPRTSFGWKGFLYDPLLNGTNQIHLGIEWTRQLFLELNSLEMPCATEFLDPLTAFYFDDLISWGSIGARTSSAQTHRQFASGLSMPIGFKNSVTGNCSGAINGVYSACQPHTYIGNHLDGQLTVIQTKGNRDAHLVLRGGDSGPNYQAESIEKALLNLSALHLPTRVIVDCSHQNSNKQFTRQPAIFEAVIDQIVKGNSSIRGLMLESHLFSGMQPLNYTPSGLKYGVSITDGCLDFATTAQLIQLSADYLRQKTDLLQEVN